MFMFLYLKLKIHISTKSSRLKNMQIYKLYYTQQYL